MNTKTIIISILAVVVVFGVIIWIAKPSSQDGNANTDLNPENKLVLQESMFDFGTISMKDGKVSHSFTIKNDSAEKVIIKKIYTSCMCTEASLVKNGNRFGPFGMPGHGLVPSINQSINPGEESVIEVVFDPSAHGPSGVGKIQRSITIENSGQPLELQMSAVVTP